VSFAIVIGIGHPIGAGDGPAVSETCPIAADARTRSENRTAAGFIEGSEIAGR